MDNSIYIVHVTTKQIQDMNDFYILYMYNGTCSSLFYLLQNSRYQKKEIQKTVSKLQVHCLSVHTVSHCLVHIIRNAEVGGG